MSSRNEALPGESLNMPANPIKILNLTRNITLTENTIIADSFFSRLQGLLGKDGLARGEGLILKPCDSIHTFFMRFAIDVVFVDRNNRVIRLYHSLRSLCVLPSTLFLWTGITASSVFIIRLNPGELAGYSPGPPSV